MSFAIGSLVRARGREWVVLPESTGDTLIARPLGGGDSEVAGIYLPLEKVEPATFQLPDPTRPGDYRSCRLLRDALRLGFRSSAGPFRSFARIAVEPRPYQLVPLLMALKLDPVRLMIADDVGIGKTIEAGLIVRELIDRGEVRRFAVLCPPQIAEQWAEKELKAKFHLDAELVLPSTVGRLERACRLNQSIFERFPYTVVSTDFIKADRRRDDFLRSAPELVIVDEAHACAWAGEGKGTRHQRHALVKGLAENRDRHLILVTATPHSGNEGAFRSLLALLDPDFAGLPEDLGGEANEPSRRRVAAHLVQRRRADIRHFLQTDTAFPDRKEDDLAYKLSPAYRKLFDAVLAYAEERVFDETLEQRRQRIRWWSALALLRSVASSPAAAAMTLRTRAVDANTPAEADDAGRRAVMDLAEDDSAEGSDVAPPGDDEVEAEGTTATEAGRRLMQLALDADGLRDDKDPKLQKIVPVVRKLLEEGYHPILFCRFIPTAEYVAEYLRKKLKGVEVAAVTGTLPPKEREDRVGLLGKSERRVLVCTDCLSEGINLQHSFNAVIHYDLSWNPTRHEQREGRVDRFGQPSSEVRCLTFSGEDNLIDDLVLKVLLRKTRAIRNTLGVSVPLPGDGERVIQEAFKVLLKNWRKASGPGLFDELESEVDLRWRSASEREKKSQTLFAQRTINVEEVAAEMQASRQALGSGADVVAFVRTALDANRGLCEPDGRNGRFRINLKETPRALRDSLGLPDEFLARFDPAVGDGEVYLSRTHPAVESLANHVLNAALDLFAAGPARRCGVIRTSRVTTRTTLLLLRHRFHIVTKTPDGERQLLAEDAHLVAFSGSPQSPVWLPAEEAERLPEAEPDGNVLPDQAQNFLHRVIDGMESLRPKLSEIGRERGDQLLDAHRRVRQASRAKGVSHRVEAQDLPDVLGVFVYLPRVSA